MGVSFFTQDIIEQTDAGRFKKIEDAFDHCYKKGIRYGDLLARPGDYPMYLHCELLRNSGIEPECLIERKAISDFDEKTRDIAIAFTKEKIDIMAKLNIPLLMLVPSIACVRSAEEKKRSHSLMIEGYARIAEYAKGSGVTVTLENQSVSVRPDSKMEDIRELLDAVPDLKYVLDSGNFFCIGQDVEKAYELLKDRMVHIHAKDWAYSEFGDFVRENMPRFKGVPLGLGEIPLASIAEKAKCDGYKGSAVVEINSPVAWEQYDESIDFIAGKFGV